MSGTSADGIDAVLIRITGNGLDIRVGEQEFLFIWDNSMQRPA